MGLLDSHLKENNISYVDHMKRSLRWSGESCIASFALFVHSLVPFLFTHTASRRVKKIYKEMLGSTCKKCNCDL